MGFRFFRGNALLVAMRSAAPRHAVMIQSAVGRRKRFMSHLLARGEAAKPAGIDVPRSCAAESPATIIQDAWMTVLSGTRRG